MLSYLFLHSTIASSVWINQTSEQNYKVTFDGTNYIDLGFKNNNTTKTIFRGASLEDEQSGNGFALGARSTDEHDAFAWGMVSWGSASWHTWHFMMNQDDEGASIDSAMHVHELDAATGDSMFDDTVDQNQPSYSGINDYNLHLGCLNDNGSLGNFIKMDFDYLIWEHDGIEHLIDFSEGSGNKVTDNFGTEYTIMGNAPVWTKIEEPVKALQTTTYTAFLGNGSDNYIDLYSTLDIDDEYIFEASLDVSQVVDSYDALMGMYRLTDETIFMRRENSTGKFGVAFGTARGNGTTITWDLSVMNVYKINKNGFYVNDEEILSFSGTTVQASPERTISVLAMNEGPSGFIHNGAWKIKNFSMRHLSETYAFKFNENTGEFVNYSDEIVYDFTADGSTNYILREGEYLYSETEDIVIEFDTALETTSSNGKLYAENGPIAETYYSIGSSSSLNKKFAIYVRDSNGNVLLNGVSTSDVFDDYHECVFRDINGVCTLEIDGGTPEALGSYTRVSLATMGIEWSSIFAGQRATVADFFDITLSRLKLGSVEFSFNEGRGSNVYDSEGNAHTIRGTVLDSQWYNLDYNWVIEGTVLESQWKDYNRHHSFTPSSNHILRSDKYLYSETDSRFIKTVYEAVLINSLNLEESGLPPPMP